MANSVFGVLIGGVVFIGIGSAFFFLVGKPAVEQGKASREWPTAEGTVIRSKVTTSSRDGGTQYSADVTYKYMVKGQEYQSNVVRFGGNFSSNNSSGAHGIVNEYPEGKTIAVHYSPEEPGVATIETGTHWVGHIAWWIGLGAMLLGVCLLGGFTLKILLGAGIIAGALAGSIGRSHGSRDNTSTSRDLVQHPNLEEQHDSSERPCDREASDGDDGISLH